MKEFESRVSWRSVYPLGSSARRHKKERAINPKARHSQRIAFEASAFSGGWRLCGGCREFAGEPPSLGSSALPPWEATSLVCRPAIAGSPLVPTTKRCGAGLAKFPAPPGRPK
jgi:hypothetical protein